MLYLISYFAVNQGLFCLKLLCFLEFLAGLLVMPRYRSTYFNIIVLLSKLATYTCSRNLSFHFEYIKIISIINSKGKCQVASINSLMLQTP